MNFTLANTAITACALLDFLDEYRVSVTFLTLVNCWIFLEESLASLTFLTLVIFFSGRVSGISDISDISDLFFDVRRKNSNTRGECLLPKG